MFFSAVTVAAVLCVGRVAAHGGVTAYTNAGTWYPGWRPYNSPVGQVTIQRPWATFNPIEDVNSPSLACNNDGNSGPNQLVATVKAGSEITAYWNQVWPHDTGPVLVYLARCPGTTCTGVNARTLKWFKIDEAGLLSGTIYGGQWAAGKMINQNSTWTSTIPATVPSGPYLIRHETIALHSMPAQFYPECAELIITDGGDLEPTEDELVTFPGGYGANDPGVNIVIYNAEAKVSTNYVIPGPPLYGKGSSAPTSTASSSISSSTSSTSTSSSSTASVVPTQNPPVVQPPSSSSTTTSTTTTTSSSSAVLPTSTSIGSCACVCPGTPTLAPTATPSPTLLAMRWEQCGGRNWSGATVCAAPFQCNYVNEYYSQCL